MKSDAGFQAKTLQDWRLDDQVVNRAKPQIDHILALGGGLSPGGVNLSPHTVLDQEDPSTVDLERSE